MYSAGIYMTCSYIMSFLEFTFGERFEVGTTIRGLGVAVVNVRKGFGSGKEMCMSVGVEHLLDCRTRMCPTPEPQGQAVGFTIGSWTKDLAVAANVALAN